MQVIGAGLPVNKQILDSRVGNLIVQMRQNLADVRRLKAWLDGQLDEDLIGLGYAQDDIDILKSAFTDLDKLARVATAQDTQPQANDFFFWANRLTGIA